MEENKNLEMEQPAFEPEEQSAIDFYAIYTTLILNWKWFLLSLIICLGLSAIYLRYTTPRYQAVAKFLVKADENKGMRGNQIQGVTGMLNTTDGFDNELEVLRSRSVAAETVRDLKLYTTYRTSGRVKDVLMYKNQPITVDIDAPHLYKLNAPIELTITKEKGEYKVEGTYSIPSGGSTSSGPYALKKSFKALPFQIPTRAGILSFTANKGGDLAEGQTENVHMVSPLMACSKYVSSLSASSLSKTTSIANLVLTDEIPDRAIDYLRQLTVVYNRQANEDKNQVALRTEQFINNRLEKINGELDVTEGQLQSFKQSAGMTNLSASAGAAMGGQQEYERKMADANTQLELFNSINDYMNQAGNRYQLLPSGIGIEDQSTTALINRYNEIVLQRNRLLQSASEDSPVVEPLTGQLDELNNSIRRAVGQARRNFEIQRNSISSQLGRYTSAVSQTPEQERILNQIGRQQEVKSGLYLMLLQKREENSISLAATADKGKLIDTPQYAGQVAPKHNMIYMIGLIAGLALPFVVLVLSTFFRYRIEGHADVEKLTALPIIADVAVASDTAKTKADIVVHENQNNQMEEVFRSMRTNVQFMLSEKEKVVMFTSTTSGEGKTFNCANLAVSFALLGKKTIIVGLDIRKPRLAELFQIDDHQHGITPLLTKDDPTADEVQAQILPSEVHDNLDLLMAGPIPPNPTELIARPSLDRVFEILRKNYDYILIDTAPVGLVTDTIQVGRVADATIYMCRADYTAKASFELINGLAAGGKLPKMAIVINGIDMSKKKYGYYYGYGKYGKYGRYASYGRYGRYGRYGGYGRYGSRYGGYGGYGRGGYGSSYGRGSYGGYGSYGNYGTYYGSYGTYGTYGNYANSHYGDKNDTSIKR